jgi:hypothetical protein
MGSFDTLIGAEGNLDELVGSWGSLEELGASGSADMRRRLEGSLGGPAAEAVGLPHFSASARSASSPRAAEEMATAPTVRAR